MPVSAVDVIVPAFERMKRQLFQPFRFGQWLRYAVVGLLAGEMGAGGNAGARFPMNASNSRGNPFPSGIPNSPLFIAGIALLVLLALVVAVILIYVSSRMRFVLFDSVVAGECRIREYWARRSAPAFRYFVFQLLFGIVSIFGLLLIVGVPVLMAVTQGLFREPRSHLAALILGGLVILVLFLIWLTGVAIVQVLTKDFVVPQMAMDDVTASEGWKRLWRIMQPEKLSFAGYLGMKLLLSIAASVAIGIVAFILLMVVLVPVGVAILGGQAAGLTWNVATIAIAVAVGLVVVPIILLGLALISAPSIVFFPAYSIQFFADRYPPLRAALSAG